MLAGQRRHLESGHGTAHPDAIPAVKVDPTNYQIAYLASDSGVYKTTDMGMSWTQHGISNLIYSDVAIDPVNPQHIFAASNAGVFASTDGGMDMGKYERWHTVRHGG